MATVHYSCSAFILPQESFPNLRLLKMHRTSLSDLNPGPEVATAFDKGGKYVLEGFNK